MSMRHVEEHDKGNLDNIQYNQIHFRKKSGTQ